MKTDTDNICSGAPLLSVRAARESDLPELLRVYGEARSFMRRHGNPSQWSGGYPHAELLRRDISSGCGYIVERDGGAVCGAFAFFTGGDPTYEKIYGGSWLNDRPYGAIHRVAGDGTAHGIMRAVTDFCSAISGELRIDTHRDNLPMIGALEKLGFRRCGIIYLADGAERIAFHRSRERIQAPVTDN